MSKLDCENILTLTKSIENILGLKKNEIIDYYNSFSYDSNHFHSNLLFIKEIEKNGITINHTSTSWFHFTRNFPSEEYKKGLLPLNKILEYTWNKLYLLVKNEVQYDDWSDFKKLMNSGENYTKGATLYYDKINESNNQFGPYGFLVFDIDCFDKPIWDWHYLKGGSEIVYHICDAFQEIYKIDLFNIYISHTKPCIVKFEWNNNDKDNLIYALMTFINYYNNKKMYLGDIPCFSTRGSTIKFEAIEKVIYYDI